MGTGYFAERNLEQTMKQIDHSTGIVVKNAEQVVKIIEEKKNILE